MLYLKDCDSVAEVLEIFSTATEDVLCWKAIDSVSGRAPVEGALRFYSTTQPAKLEGWELLKPLLDLPGHSAGAAAHFHYVVETDVAPGMDAELNQWYDTEHLVGLAKVPGTIRASRFQRVSGLPKYLACYDLTSADALVSSEWLAVRNTQWSSRVRPYFQNTRRTMYALYPTQHLTQHP
jgi:hypothetical protein